MKTMKTTLLIAALTVAAANAFAGHMVPDIAMPIGIGYATDAKGNPSSKRFLRA